MTDPDLPAIEPALIRTLETRPKPAAVWLDRLPYASPADAAQQLLHALFAMNRSALDDATRETLLALYRPAVTRAAAGLETLLGDAGVPPHAHARQHAALLCELAAEHAIGYRHLLRDAANLPARRLAERLSRLLAALRAVQDAHALTYSPVPIGLWRDLHRIHAQARSTGLADGAIGDAAPASLLYREALLIALADPPHMSRNEFLHVRAYVRILGMLAVLRDTPPDHAGFAIDPRGDCSPQGCAGTGSLWLDTGALCRRLHDLALQLRTGDTPRHLGLPEDMESELSLLVAKRLSKRWRNAAQRTFARHPADGPVLEVVAGVCAIHRLLTQAPPLSDRASDLPIRDVAVFTAAPAAVQSSRWTIRNDSAAGLALSGTPDASLNLKVGDALATRGRQDTDWSLAVIRWIAMHEDGRVELGIERLAPQMRPIWVRPLRGLRKRPEPALLVPGLPSLKQPDRLLLPRFLYAPAMDAEIQSAPGLCYLSFGRRLEHTPNFDLVDFDVLSGTPSA